MPVLIYRSKILLPFAFRKLCAETEKLNQKDTQHQDVEPTSVNETANAEEMLLSLLTTEEMLLPPSWSEKTDHLLNKE